MAANTMAKLPLTKILQKLSDELGADDFCDALRAASPQNKGPDKRTLERILREETAPNLDHLKAIHAFLRKRGGGLDTVRIFEPDELLRSLVEPGEMTFYLPTIVHDSKVGNDKREYVSSWDFRAFCAVTDQVNKLGAHVITDFQTEPPQPPQAQLENAPWGDFLASERRTYCAIGSPLVCGLTSYMLGKMFDVPNPFGAPTVDNDRLPFYFCWYPPDDAAARRRYPSAFALNAQELWETFPKLVGEQLVHAINARQAQAFVFSQNQKYRVEAVRLGEHPHDQYGVIVAQRRGPQSIWLVIAGLSGPGTFACAQLLHQIKLSLPDCKAGEVSPVVVAAVKSETTKDAHEQHRDARKVVKSEFVAQPILWSERS